MQGESDEEGKIGGILSQVVETGIDIGLEQEIVALIRGCDDNVDRV